jgi:hypothetical protein
MRDAATLSTELGLKFPDSVMLASILADAARHQSPSVFLNRDTGDFDDPAVRAHLERSGCDLIGKFSDGLARVLANTIDASL